MMLLEKLKFLFSQELPAKRSLFVKYTRKHFIQFYIFKKNFCHSFFRFQ